MLRDFHSLNYKFLSTSSFNWGRWLKVEILREKDMVIVRKLDPIQLERDSKHSEVDCTYAIVEDDKGDKYLQIDTYGSATRQIPGKKSQSISFSQEAIKQLKEILEKYF